MELILIIAAVALMIPGLVLWIDDERRRPHNLH
jgi:hypothetical protein